MESPHNGARALVAALSVMLVLPGSALASIERLRATVQLNPETNASAEVEVRAGATDYATCLVFRLRTGIFELAACRSVTPGLRASMDAVQGTEGPSTVTMSFVDDNEAAGRCFQARAINSLVGSADLQFVLTGLFTDPDGTRRPIGPVVVPPNSPTTIGSVQLGGTGCEVGNPPPPPVTSPPPVTPPPPTQGGTINPPQIGRRATAGRVSGKVLVKRRGASGYVELTDDESIPVGSVVDTRRGRVRITVAVEDGKTQTAEFYGGVFKLVQKRGARPVAEMRLTGKLENCGANASSSTLARAAKRRGRRLWGSGKGRFRSRGRYSSATVRGTVWLVADRCDGSTLTRVTKGSVTVRDFAKRKNIVVKRGRRYVTKPRRR